MSYPHASDITFIEGVFRLAVINNKTVTFWYSKGDDTSGQIEQRRLKPSGVAYAKKDGNVYFSGFDPDRKGVRAFRLDRVLEREVSLV